MRKKLPYLIALPVVIAILLVLFSSKKRDKQKNFNSRITLKKTDKNPYGTHVAFQGLKNLFPEANIVDNQIGPLDWKSDLFLDSGQTFMAVSSQFYASEYEMEQLVRFVENGNNVFISTRSVSSAVRNLIHANIVEIVENETLAPSGKFVKDSLLVGLDGQFFENAEKFSYKGKAFESRAYDVDSSYVNFLGYTSHYEWPNFIHLRAGKGNFYLHLSPLCFSNYFLLHKKNIAYYENVLSVIFPNSKKILWDEYYLKRKYANYPNQDNKNALAELFRHKETKWAVLLAIFILLLYVFLEMRRRQRAIPLMPTAQNDSLDFAKTIGRLYYEKQNHNNLCRKMALYFLEHVRETYKLSTANLDNEFMQKLQYKTGKSITQIEPIISFIQQLNNASVIHQKQVFEFYNHLESFYHK